MMKQGNHHALLCPVVASLSFTSCPTVLLNIDGRGAFVDGTISERYKGRRDYVIVRRSTEFENE